MVNKIIHTFHKLFIRKSLNLQDCPPHTWESETLTNEDTKDSITYLYCSKCQVLAGCEGKRETFNNIE
jgi:hypothetical protein